jgi:hypothetical protein
MDDDCARSSDQQQGQNGPFDTSIPQRVHDQGNTKSLNACFNATNQQYPALWTDKIAFCAESGYTIEVLTHLKKYRHLADLLQSRTVVSCASRVIA